MSLRIAEQYPRPALLRRFGRALVLLLGALLTLGGIVAATLPLLFAVLFVLTLFVGDGPSRMESDLAEMLIVLTAIALVALPLGRWLLRGRRRLVLYLRRFGFADSAEALTFAVGTAVGNRWRVVTLDDAQLGAVGVKKGVRRTFRLGRWIGLLAIAGGLLWGYLWLTGEAPGEIFDKISSDIFESGSGNFVERFLGAAAGGCFLTLIIVLFAAAAGLIGLAFIGLLTLFTWGSHRAVRKAERVKAREILTEKQLEPAVRAAARLSRRLFAPRLMVMRVATALWKRAVLDLAKASSVVLIDISDPTPNLVWEVETLRDATRSRWLLVGRRDRLEMVAGGGDSAAAARLAQLLDGEEALAYAGEDRKSMRRFARSLGGRLHQLG